MLYKKDKFTGYCWPPRQQRFQLWRLQYLIGLNNANGLLAGTPTTGMKYVVGSALF